jgi:hypothetical protein
MVGTVWTPPPAAGVEATLVVARWLLNNPPSAHASPSATEQWHHNVDQLIIMDINTPHHEGGRQEPTVAHSHSPSTARAPPSTRVPRQTCVLLSITTADLCDELIHRHRGGRIVTSPSSATVRGVATSRAATSSDILNLLRQHEWRMRRMLCASLALQQALGVYGACTTSLDVGLAAQVPSSSTREVRWDG